MNTNLQWYRPKKKNINFIDGDLSKILKSYFYLFMSGQWQARITPTASLWLRAVLPQNPADLSVNIRPIAVIKP